MCGIAGTINLKLKHQNIVGSMLHRGPDGQTFFENANVQLFHWRLAIQDLTGGAQPMHLKEKTIVFNGEIYNHKELRLKYGLKCATNSDTETLLHLYESFGIQFLDEVDGMFALCIYDKKENNILLARDRAGKKPLYVFQKNGTFAFASELNALRQMVSLEADDSQISAYLRFGFLYGSHTPYKDVYEVEPGSYKEIHVSDMSSKTVKWWDIGRFYNTPQKPSFEECLNKTNDNLHLAIKRRVDSSDLEVGAFLSGGIDSGLVTAIASEYNPNIKTFTVAFDGSYDESHLAKLVASKYGTKHTEIHISFDHLEDDIETIISNYGEPYADSSAIPSFYVSKAAKKHLTVILNGDGADELFAGYRRYVPFARWNLFDTPFLSRKMTSWLIPLLPQPHNKKNKYNYLYRLMSITSKSGLSAYLSATSDIFEDFEKYLIASIQSGSTLHDAQTHLSKILKKRTSSLKKIMEMDFSTILSGDLLVKMDIATMAHSLEGRSPFLSKEMLEYAPTIPDYFKINSTHTKYLLRRLAEKYLPYPIINQPKRGFEIPLKKWVENDLRSVILDSINSTSAYHRSFVESSFVEKLVQKRIAVSDEKRAKMLWAIYCLNIWHNKIHVKT
jgi:asparagine synthase (glutamine-hydrolysing)